MDEFAKKLEQLGISFKFDGDKKVITVTGCSDGNIADTFLLAKQFGAVPVLTVTAQ